jgi:hypothetical protein
VGTEIIQGCGSILPAGFMFASSWESAR